MKKRTQIMELQQRGHELSTSQLNAVFGGFLARPMGAVDSGTLNGRGDPDHITDEEH